jgi:hypothetical protein
MADDIYTTEEEVPPPDEIEEPAPSPDQEKLWGALDAVTTADTFLREIKLSQIDHEARKRLASIGLASTLEKMCKEYAFDVRTSQTFSFLIQRFAIHDLTLTGFTQELIKAIGEEKGKKLMVDSALHDILKLWAGGANLFGESEIKAKPIDAVPATIQKPLPATPPTPKTAPIASLEKKAGVENEEETVAPFILHEEKSPFTSTTPKIQSSVNFDILRAPRNAPAPKPITVKIESPYDKPKENTPRRVVHYSNLRTPLNTDAKDAK